MRDLPGGNDLFGECCPGMDVPDVEIVHADAITPGFDGISDVDEITMVKEMKQ